MDEKPSLNPEPRKRHEDQLPEAEADARFDMAIKNALAMAPRPHKPKAEPKG
jgi:hypothetical protein